MLLLSQQKKERECGISFLYLSMMKEHDMAIVTSGFSPRPLLLAISAKWRFLSFSQSWTGLCVRRSRNIEFQFVDRQGSDARTRSIVGDRKIKRDQNSYCSRAGITICHIPGNLAVKLLKNSPQD